MAIQFSSRVVNGVLDQIEAIIGASPVLEIRTGAPPANCLAADSGTVLATLALPISWMNDAADGVKTKAGTWEDASCDDTGTAGHFRLKQGSSCDSQGTITVTGGGGDLTVDSTSFTAGQNFTITSYSFLFGA